MTSTSIDNYIPAPKGPFWGIKYFQLLKILLQTQNAVFKSRRLTHSTNSRELVEWVMRGIYANTDASDVGLKGKSLERMSAMPSSAWTFQSTPRRISLTSSRDGNASGSSMPSIGRVLDMSRPARD